MRKDIFINGIDCSSMFTRYGYDTDYFKVEGNAGGIMLDGSETVDVLRIKALVTMAVMPMTEVEMSRFVNLVSSDYVDVTYFDIKQLGYRTIKAIPSEVSTRHLMTNAFDDEMWSAKAVSFKESGLDVGNT